MSHVAANNEIIRMRATVRKARVGVVWNLTKQTRLLRNRKHGDEKTLQKCKKKSEKFIREIKTIKRLKDDEITKFAILNTRNLQEVLMDLKADRKTRVMTKLAFHKSLKAAVDKFREKFPHYKLGKRQMANDKLTKSLGISPPPRQLQGGNGEDGKINSKNSEDNCNENEDSDDDNASGDEKSEETTSIVLNSSDGENSDEKLELQNQKSKSGIKGEDETPELVENEIKLPESKHPMRTQIPAPTEFKSNKISRKRILPPPNSKPKEEAIEEDSPQSSEIQINYLTRNEEFDSKHSKNIKFLAPSNNLGGRNIVEETSELTLTTPLQSQKSSRNHKKSSSKYPENSSNDLSPSQSKQSSQKPAKIEIVSNLASVKRLKIGETLEETDELSGTLHLPSKEQKLELDTAEDSFFISASPGGVYKSIVVPRPNTETPENGNAKNRFREPFPNSQRASFDSRNSLHHREETAVSRKGDRVRQNDFRRNKRDCPERREFARGGREAEFRNNDKFGKSRSRETIDSKKDGCEENLHPSWIARKKQQEISKQGFQGKKIVFDDD